ncbi:hypothetical protein EAKF1_ch2911 [Escherichia albertii KF1]|nr:hypothetical protein EAKF1_ch2911 [Escherichia albertii KF1]
MAKNRNAGDITAAGDGVFVADWVVFTGVIFCCVLVFV